MSTTLEPQPSPPPEKEDPWRHGWRYVRRFRPDGTEYTEQIPLRQEDLLYPEESDFVVDTEGHNDDCRYLKTGLRQAVGGEGVLVLSDHRVDWEVAGLRPLGPDVVVFDGLREAWDPNRGTIPVQTFGARTLLVVEVTSPDTRANDLGIKVEFYRRVGALFYAVVDRHETRGGLDLRLFGYRADQADLDHYTEVAPDGRGRLWLETVRLWLAAEDGRAVLYDEQNNRIPDHDELLRRVQAASKARQEAETRAAEDAKARQVVEARIKDLEAELQRLRGEKGGPPNPAAP